MSLREELRTTAPAEPSVLLPSAWRWVAPEDADSLPSPAHRRQLREARILAGGGSTLALGIHEGGRHPASLVAVARRASPEGFAAFVAQRHADAGAAHLGEDRRIVRWATERTATEPTKRLHYLAMVPGTRRTRAVEWIAAISPEGAPLPDDTVLLWAAAMDAVVGTLEWRRGA